MHKYDIVTINCLGRPCRVQCASQIHVHVASYNDTFNLKITSPNTRFDQLSLNMNDVSTIRMDTRWWHKPLEAGLVKSDNNLSYKLTLVLIPPAFGNLVEPPISHASTSAAAPRPSLDSIYPINFMLRRTFSEVLT